MNDNDIDIEEALSITSNEDVQVLDKATKTAGRPLKNGEKAKNRVVIYLTDTQIEEIEYYCYKNRKKIGTYIKELFFSTFYEIKDKEENNIDNFINNIDSKLLGEKIKNFLKREE